MLTLGQEFAGIYNVCHLFWLSYFVVFRCLLNLTMRIVEKQLLKDGSIQNDPQPGIGMLVNALILLRNCYVRYCVWEH